MFILSYKLGLQALTYLYYFPIALQFMTFSLLVVFYAFLLYQHKWAQLRKFYIVGYAVINITVFIITNLYVRHITSTANGGSETTFGRFNGIYMSVQFSILVFLYAYFGYQLYSRRSSRTFVGITTPNSLTALTIISGTIFVSRWLYNVLVVIDSEKFSIVMSYGNDGLLDISPSIFTLLSIWEIIPSSLVVMLFRDIPRTKRTLLALLHQREMCLCLGNSEYKRRLQMESESQAFQQDMYPGGFLGPEVILADGHGGNGLSGLPHDTTTSLNGDPFNTNRGQYDGDTTFDFANQQQIHHYQQQLLIQEMNKQGNGNQQNTAAATTATNNTMLNAPFSTNSQRRMHPYGHSIHQPGSSSTVHSGSDGYRQVGQTPLPQPQSDLLQMHLDHHNISNGFDSNSLFH